MNRRIRSSDSCAARSDSCAACSDSCWARNAVSIWLSMMLSERPRLPISVRGSRSGMRWSRCPLAIWPAVISMSSSGRRLARTTAMPTIASTTTIAVPTISSTVISRWISAPTGPRSTARTMKTVCCAFVALLMTGTAWAITRQVSPPDCAGTVVSTGLLGFAQLPAGNSGRDWAGRELPMPGGAGPGLFATSWVPGCWKARISRTPRSMENRASTGVPGAISLMCVAEHRLKLTVALRIQVLPQDHHAGDADRRQRHDDQRQHRRDQLGAQRRPV